MRRSSPPAHADDTVRRRIVEATISVIATDGLDAVRHRRIADLAGVSLGSTSYHFASRDDLVEAAFLHYLDLATEFLDQLTASIPATGAPATRIVRFIERLLVDEFEQRGLVQAEYELILFATRKPQVAARLEQWEDAQRTQLAALLRDAGGRRADDDARTLLALTRGIELEGLTRGAPIPDLRRRLDRVVRSMLES